jgi:ribosomal protein S18 acetylase RimI-like enzyme
MNDPQTVSVDGVRIRQEFVPGDVGAIIRLHAVLYHEEHGFDRTFEAYVAEGLARFVNEFDPARSCLWVAERGGDVVGSIAIVGDAGGAAQLRWFLVHPYCRSMGVGRRLLADSIAFARETGARSIFLWTVSDLDAAIRLYRAAGFRVTEEKSGLHWGQQITEQRFDLDL